MRAASVSEFRELARRRLPHIFFEYIDGGSYAERPCAATSATWKPSHCASGRCAHARPT